MADAANGRESIVAGSVCGVSDKDPLISDHTIQLFSSRLTHNCPKRVCHVCGSVILFIRSVSKHSIRGS